MQCTMKPLKNAQKHFPLYYPTLLDLLGNWKSREQETGQEGNGNGTDTIIISGLFWGHCKTWTLDLTDPSSGIATT